MEEVPTLAHWEQALRESLGQRFCWEDIGARAFALADLEPDEDEPCELAFDEVSEGASLGFLDIDTDSGDLMGVAIYRFPTTGLVLLVPHRGEEVDWTPRRLDAPSLEEAEAAALDFAEELLGTSDGVTPWDELEAWDGDESPIYRSGLAAFKAKWGRQVGTG